MFKWPGLPSESAPGHELADFAELACWQQGHMSAVALSKALGRHAENDYSIDGVLEEEEVDKSIENAFRVIEWRQEACGGKYPFELTEKGQAIRIIHNADEPAHTIYKYLLLSTRLNMSRSRSYAGHDGTLILEKLAARVARTYFGGRAQSLVFGTAVGGAGFKAKVDELCERLGEGGEYNAKSPRRDTKDGKLDVVSWNPFSDGLTGKLIGFGQCKTGTHYRDSLSVLQPDAFTKKWMIEPLAVPPVRMFFISEALGTTSTERFEDSVEAGLLFDRCRMVDFCDDVDEETLGVLRDWTAAAAMANDLPD